MNNRLKDLMLERNWTQQELADRVNALFCSEPDLAKPTKKNPTGAVGQQTIQRLVNGETLMNERWIGIFSKVFKVPSYVIYCPEGIPEWLAPHLEKLNNASPEFIDVMTTLLNSLKKHD